MKKGEIYVYNLKPSIKINTQDVIEICVPLYGFVCVFIYACIYTVFP